jgi:tetratricopeptide (TPR) repeat protein
MNMQIADLHRRGVEAFRNNNFEESLASLRSAAEMAAQGEQTKLLAEILNDLAVVEKQQKDYAASLKSIRQAIDIYKELEDQRGAGQALGNMASLLQETEKYEEAAEGYRQSALLLEEAGEDELAMYSWQALSRLRLKQKKFFQAIGAYEEGLDGMPEKSFKKKMIKGLMNFPQSMIGLNRPEDKNKND